MAPGGESSAWIHGWEILEMGIELIIFQPRFLPYQSMGF
jgi:hypothetical protein